MKPTVITLVAASAALLVVALLIWDLPALDGWSLQSALDWLASQPRWMIMLFVLGAPLAGVPLSGTLIVVGAVFPFAGALALIVVVLLVHHLLLGLLRRSRMRARLHQAMVRRGLLRPASDRPRRLVDDLGFILIATWVPGLSYVFKVALTAVSDLPFRTYLLAGVLSQTLAALPYLVLGQVAEEANLSVLGLAVFGLAVAVWLIKRGVERYRLRVADGRDGR